MKAGLAPGLVKNKRAKDIWWLMYFSGPKNTNWPGLIVNPKLTDLKATSSDFSRRVGAGIELLVGGTKIGRTLTLQTPLSPEIFFALIRKASLPGPMVTPSIEPMAGT